jgi:hypothetical protein
MKLLLITFMILLAGEVLAQGKKIATIKILRGTVELLSLGKTTKLNLNDWVSEGASLRTLDKSFVRLVFVDKSQMNIGPKSEIKIEKFTSNDAGVINLIKGQVRSQVTKDYLQIKDKNASKLFIKTPNAVMGVRGTDFMVTANEKTTSTILFEGEVVFNKIEGQSISDPRQLEDIVDRGVKIHPGEFSVVDKNQPTPTVPAVLNVQQLEKLEKNVTFTSRAPSNAASEENKKSIVPPGLSGQLVSNDASSIKKEIAQVAGPEVAKVEPSRNSHPDGFIEGDKVKPANGSFIHLESGVIIPPGPGSVLDPNTNSYVASPETGRVAPDGSFIPPKNVEITPSGNIFVTVTNQDGSKKMVEVSRPAPVKDDAARAPAFSVGSTNGGIVISPPPKDAPLISPNDPANRNATGGVTTVNDANQQIHNGYDVPRLRTIQVER